MSDADVDGDGEPDGHDADRQEDTHDYLDAMFSRSGVIGTFIGLSAGKVVENVVRLGASDPVAAIAAWLVVFPAAVAFGVAWPYLERRFAWLFPWMDADP